MDPNIIANTLALNRNTLWVAASTIVGIFLFIWGYNKYKGKNVIKKTRNKLGTINQHGRDNIIDQVDNEEGTINQQNE